MSVKSSLGRILLAAGFSLLLLPVTSARADDTTCKCTTRCDTGRCLGTCSTLAREGVCACASGEAGGAAVCETTHVSGTIHQLQRTRVLTPMSEASSMTLWGCHPLPLSPQPSWVVARYAPRVVGETGHFASEAVNVLAASSRELMPLGAVSSSCTFEAVGWPGWSAEETPALTVTEAVFLPGKATRAVEAWPVVKKGYLGKRVLPNTYSGPAVLRFKTDGTRLTEVRLEEVPGEKKKTHLFVQHLTEAVTLRRPTAAAGPATGFLVAWLNRGKLVQLDLGAVFVPDPSPTAAAAPLPD